MSVSFNGYGNYGSEWYRNEQGENVNATVVGGSDENVGAEESSIQTYKKEISEKNSAAEYQLSTLQRTREYMKGPTCPDKDEFMKEDNTFDEFRYDVAYKKYEFQLEQFNKRVQEIEKKIEDLQKEIKKYQLIMQQLDSIEGTTISEELLAQIEEAITTKSDIENEQLEKVLVDDKDIQSYIDEYSGQLCILSRKVADINSQIEIGSGAEKPTLAKFINADGTINVDGYIAAVQKYNKDMKRLVELYEELDKTIQQYKDIEKLVNELGHAETVKEFEEQNSDLITKVEQFNASEETMADSDEKELDLEGLSNDDLRQQLQSSYLQRSDIEKETADIISQRKEISQQLIVLGSQQEALISEYETANAKMPNISQFMTDGKPNVSAYNEAVRVFNAEQEERLKKIEKLTDEIIKLQDDDETLKTKLQQLAVQHSEITQTIKALEQEAEKRDDSNLLSFNEVMKRLDILFAKSSNGTVSIDEILAALNISSEELEKLMESNQELKLRLANLDANKGSMDAEIEDIKKIIEDTVANIKTFIEEMQVGLSIPAPEIAKLTEIGKQLELQLTSIDQAKNSLTPADIDEIKKFIQDAIEKFQIYTEEAQADLNISQEELEDLMGGTGTRGGLAASQARLLAMTAVINDVEFQMEQIKNKIKSLVDKMEVAQAGYFDIKEEDLKISIPANKIALQLEQMFNGRDDITEEEIHNAVVEIYKNEMKQRILNVYQRQLDNLQQEESRLDEEIYNLNNELDSIKGLLMSAIEDSFAIISW